MGRLCAWTRRSRCTCCAAAAAAGTTVDVAPVASMAAAVATLDAAPADAAAFSWLVVALAVVRNCCFQAAWLYHINLRVRVTYLM